MAPVADQLKQTLDGFKERAPEEISGPILRSRDEHIAQFDRSKVPKVGTELPDFKLTNAAGIEVSRQDLLSKGPILITFYRGNWCPFCNLELRGLQSRYEEFRAKGVQLVAISPQLPDGSLNTVEKHSLKFEVLSDVGNKLARQLNIVWSMPDYVRPTFTAIGHDLEAVNGDNSFEVPVPSNILVDKAAVIRNIHVDPDYTARLEPSTAMEWVDALS